MSRLSFLTSLVTLALVSSTYAGVGPVVDLTVSNAVISPDGFDRDAIVVNGVFPAPLITGKKGDRFQLNVIDNMTNHTMLKSTSIHWHGFFQKGTNWADGGAFVNQCPIAPGHSFLYDFRVPDQAGTFWYHSHLSTQYCDGLRGPIVVYDPNDPHADLYDVDNDSTVITLADWYHVAARLGPRFPLGADSTVINGLGRSLSTPNADLAVISVTQGKRYRFRLISLSCDPFHTFSIDGHDLTIIEADSVNTEPLVVDAIPIFAGQRYSFVLSAVKDIDNYWIRADPNFGTTGFASGINSAILRYDGAAPIEPTAVLAPVSVNPLVETDLHPLEDMPVPGRPTKGGVDKAINLDFSFSFPNFFINNATFTSPTVPILLQIMSGAQAAQDLLPSGSVIELPAQSTIELTLPATVNAPGVPHPFHLHGHTFAVVRSAGSTAYNYDNPIWRDVVSTGTPAANDNVTIRFTTDNPGPWFLHCHIDFHLEAGFAVVFAEGVPQTQVANPVPQAWEELCPIYDALPEDDQ
uniref:laccase n=1 Tax=Trachydermella tsunodae TaxID=372689 RepID=O61263_9APHY|nr:bilirubin oxidase [Trachydermella tsunodae]